ncbi:hypothetical protein ACHAXT_003000 [Thalassiosira profunda]
MPAPERNLLPSGHDGLAAATVVGVVPPAVHELLGGADGAAVAPRAASFRGTVDHHGSGLSFLLSTENGGDGGGSLEGAVAVWEHATQTPNEELAAPPGPCLRLVHPEHITGTESDGATRELLVACVGPDDALASGRRALRHVYAASPATGVVAAWVLSSVRGPKDSPECDASVRLRLGEGEALTALVPAAGGGGGDAWLLAATDWGRVWKIYKTARPLTLHAKLVKGEKVAGDALGDEEEEGTGILTGLYNYLTTPAKKARRADEMEEGGDGGSEDIAALVPLPVNAWGRSKVTTAGPSTSPMKQRRLSERHGAYTGALSLSSSLVLREWRASLSTGTEGRGGGGEGYVSRTDLFPRWADGTLDLEGLATAGGAHEGLEGYTDIDMVAEPSLARDGSSLLVAVRIEREGAAAAARIYVARIALDGTEPRLLDAAWLDRYSGQSVARHGGLECAGLAAAEGDDGDLGGVTAYVVFGPTGATGEGGQPYPVTVSVVHFPAVAGQPASLPRTKDMDLTSNVVPSVFRNTVSYDPLTGGCAFLSSTGVLGGATGARDASTEEGGPLDEALAKDEAVLTIKSHLMSAFRQYLAKAREGGGAGSARAVMPPSVGGCPSYVLSAAVVLASREYARAASGGGASPFSPRASSPVTALRDKLTSHQEFINFLAHGGAYRRVSLSGRMALRDHGETIAAARALLTGIQAYFSKAEASAGDDARRSELANLRLVVSGATEGASQDVSALPTSSWARLQHLAADGAAPGRDLLLLSSSSICRGINQALQYRQDESGPLYDIPSTTSTTPGSHSPWTSSADALDVLTSQLQAIRQSSDSVSSSSADMDADQTTLQQCVADLAAAALSGHKDAVQRMPDNADALKSYEETKILAVPLLRQYVNDDGDDLVALQTSLAHSFFEGIVQICHDHRGSWMHRGPFCDKEPDERYDLRPMLSNAAAESPYAHLHESPDFRTGLPFCAYVFRWYANREMYPEVFELGKNCPHDLMRYVRNDGRLSDMAWVQHLRVGAHEQATVGLLGQASPDDGSMGLWEKDVDVSLAKLSNKLASAKSSNHAVASQRTALIESSLTLISAQRILQEDTELGDEIALPADDLLRLACEKIQSATDVDDIKRFGICGLAIASARPLEQIETVAEDASAVWNEIIQADIHTWQSVAKENNQAVGGMDEEELIQRVEGTGFVGVMFDYVTTSPPGGKMQYVGFLSEAVRTRVFHSLGSDASELSQVLTLSAEIVVASCLEN